MALAQKQNYASVKEDKKPRDNQRWYKQIEGYTWGYMFLDWKNQYCENNYITQGNLQI